jgi:CheY-like chemotaxis protein
MEMAVNNLALVVDDSRSARFALRKFLETLSYQVDAVESGPDALSYLQQSQPSVIFLDHIMPGTDGFEVLRLIKANPQTYTIPVVICSSNEGEEFTQQALQRGAFDLLQKPPSLDQLAKVLEKLKGYDPVQANRPTPSVAPVQHAYPALQRPIEASPAISVMSKVQPIRDPEVAIEQAVMKNLREQLPSVPAMPVAVAPEPISPTVLPERSLLASRLLAATESVTPPVNPASSTNHLLESFQQHIREEFDMKLRRVLQESQKQFQELREGLNVLENSLHKQNTPTGFNEDQVRQVAFDAVKQHTQAIAQSLEAHLGEFGRGIEKVLNDQNVRINSVVAAAREAAAEEAHAVAERAVMNASKRVSEQLSNSILRALMDNNSTRLTG